MVSRKLTWLVILPLAILLAGCGVLNQPEPTATLPPPTETPLPTPTAVPPRMVSICLGQEPLTLYPYGSPARSTWSVLETVYDGPVDTRQFTAQPVILGKLPSIADGDAAITAVAVRTGQEVVDIDGELVSLAAGVTVLPAGCSSPDCAVTWDGSAALQMDQLKVDFRLKPALQWSDSTPLKASDSVYSFELSGNPDTPAVKDVFYRTGSYTALDDQTVEWVGVPGYLPYQFENLFWLPLPEHAWKSISAKDLLTAPESSQKPLGWGPYTVEEWVKGDHITLKKNPLYFRASEGLPYFDTLVFRFLGEPFDNNLAGLLSGECDLIDQTTLLEEQIEPVLEAQTAGKLKVTVGQGPEWEQVSFGINPSAYDDGYAPWGGDRANFFGDVRTRKAFAYCMDRAEILRKPLENQTTIPVGFFPPGHPYYLDQQPIPFDPEAGKQLLDEVGWQDLDGDPNTPRTAIGILDVVDGTPLAVNYVTTQAPLRTLIGQRLAGSLAQCGIQVNVQALNTGDLYTPGGSGGVVFGRNFDLAEFAWDSGVQPPCGLYNTEQIPNAANNWVGINITGYSSGAYDAACVRVDQARPGQADSYSQAVSEVQRIFAEDLPVVPLYFRMKVAATRPDFCGFEMDVSARTSLWNIEAFNYGETCQ
jgi:peptide/nickel transport system substrate-binding protein